MLIFRARRLLPYLCFFFCAPLPLLHSQVQIQASDGRRFSVTTIPAGGDPDAIVVADVNHDGIPDILATNPNAGTVTVLLGDKDRSFHPAHGSPFPAGHLPNDIAVGDFNSDGKPDLLIVNTQTPYLTLLLGDGSGGFHPAPHSPFTTDVKPHPHGVVAGHFCGDKQPLDAVIDSWASAEIELLHGDGSGTLLKGSKFPPGQDRTCPCGQPTSIRTASPIS